MILGQLVLHFFVRVWFHELAVLARGLCFSQVVDSFCLQDASCTCLFQSFIVRIFVDNAFFGLMFRAWASGLYFHMMCGGQSSSVWWCDIPFLWCLSSSKSLCFPLWNASWLKLQVTCYKVGFFDKRVHLPRAFVFQTIWNDISLVGLFKLVWRWW